MATGKGSDAATGDVVCDGSGQHPANLPVVGIGTYAGGVPALQKLVEHIPADGGIAWVMIQHMAPDHASGLKDILQRKSAVPVIEVLEDMPVQADQIYLIPPGKMMTITQGVLQLSEDVPPISHHTSIDTFLVSLAENHGACSGCALLSGTGSDGTIGLKAIKESGGLTLTQSLSSAQQDGVPFSANRTGLVDREVEIAEMPALFAEFLIKHQPIAHKVQIEGDNRQKILETLRAAIGHDFGGYKSNSVDRRIMRRMQLQGCNTLAEYLVFLKSSEQEPSRLFRDLLIGVTHFFRDPDSFAALSVRVLDKILENKTQDDEVRVWVPGCSSGEEVYSIAMLLIEKAEKLDSPPNIKIFGSDVDVDALHTARVGSYPQSIAAHVSKERLERFFEPDGGNLVVSKKLREVCLFAQHDLLSDPPFSRTDLISCRNVLIYMGADLQRRLLPVFHYALRKNSFLFLGSAESVSANKLYFEIVDQKNHIYRSVGDRVRLPDFPISSGDINTRPKVPRLEADTQFPTPNRVISTAQHVLERYNPAYVIVDSSFEIIEASRGTGKYLELPSGRPSANLALMARSNLAFDMKSAISEVFKTGKMKTQSITTINPEGERRVLTLIVEPMPPQMSGQPQCLLIFQSGPAVGTTSERDGPGDRDDEQLVRALSNELQATKERLHTTLEQVETSNEELRASNEEMSSVSEELQSSNEELETSKEELQSINEELSTVNAELSMRVIELSRANNDLKNLFNNTRIAIVFLDTALCIRSFTPSAKDLFRLRDHDVGRPLDELSGRISYQQMKTEISQVVVDGIPIEHEVETLDGDPRETHLMRLVPYRNEKEEIRGVVLTFVDITKRKQSERRLSGMVSELNHRVKNTLAIVQAMFGRAADRVSTKEELKETLVSQVQALSAAHGILARSDWESVQLHDLAAAILSPFCDPASDRLDMQGPNFVLNPRAAVPLGLVLQELATNAGKYGAWSGTAGRVTLHWEKAPGDGNMLRLAWRESGGPAVIPAEKPGFGLNFISESTQYELRGTVQTDFRSDGLWCELELPLNWVLLE